MAIIDSLSVGDVTYYLVYRVSGWSDKTEILELYNGKPTFDHCSKSNVEPLYGDSLELSKKISHVYLKAEENIFEIEYINGKAPDKNNYSLRLEKR